VNYKSVGGDMAIEATLTAWAEVTKDTSIEVVVEAPTSEKRATQVGGHGCKPMASDQRDVHPQMRRRP
jgi:acylphosphatase